MTTDTDQLALTSFHYRQIDFLRLFKLARQLGVIKRKRKMPVEYKGEDEKAYTNARSACRRLLREVIKHTFPGYELNSNWNHYYVHIPDNIRRALSYLRRNYGRLERHSDRNVRDVIAHYGLLVEHIDSHIYPSFPYQINIHLSSSRRGRYRRAMRRARGRAGEETRPSENFHKCALACLEYKKLWDRYIGEIVDVAEILQKEDATPKPAKKKKVAEVPNSETDIRDAIDRHRETREERVRNAQNTFDQALSRYKDRRGMG